ncbi:MAG: hypothetical protein EOP86_18805 [Verrucomicrobiaceae bacterium]|nr:MAG: hypothetical protein EOP86_18805 [Verrucomicrobiaceae bacterium]
MKPSHPLPTALLSLLMAGTPVLLKADITVLHTWTMGDEEKGTAGSPAAQTLVDTTGDLDLTVVGSPVYAASGSALGVLFANTDSAHNMGATEYFEGAEAKVNPTDIAKWGVEAIVRIDVIPAENQELAVVELGGGTQGIVLQTFGKGAWTIHQSNVVISAATIPVRTGELQHVAAVHNNGKWELYVDGLLATSFNSADYDPAPGIRIGAGNVGGGNNRGFNGLIETVRVFEFTDTFAIEDTLLSTLNPDSDRDGFDDTVETALGFDPRDVNSTPESRSGIETAVEFSFYAAKNKKYTIESSSDLQNWTPVQTDIPGLGGEITRLYSKRGQTKLFYRSVRQAE